MQLSAEIGGKDWKVANLNKKRYKYMKLYTCYFFSFSGALLKSHTSRNTEYFQMPQTTPGRGSQRIKQNIELFPGELGCSVFKRQQSCS